MASRDLPMIEGEAKARRRRTSRANSRRRNDGIAFEHGRGFDAISKALH